MKFHLIKSFLNELICYRIYFYGIILNIEMDVYINIYTHTHTYIDIISLVVFCLCFCKKLLYYIYWRVIVWLNNA